MAYLEPKKIVISNINGGKEYENGDGVQPELFNEMVEGILYNDKQMEVIVSDIDTTEVTQKGTPSVSWVETTVGGNRYKKLKFSNLGGADLFLRNGVGLNSIEHQSADEEHPTVASGANAIALGVGTKASGVGSISEGSYTEASGDTTHAEGTQTKAKGNNSHTEGLKTETNGDQSHAEGWSAKTGAGATASHAEGYKTEANGLYSHAGGNSTKANGVSSHAGGEGTIANMFGETAVGLYNEPARTQETNRTKIPLFTVGNGESDTNRNNAFQVFKDGHAEVDEQGNTDNSVATVKFVKDKIKDINIENGSANGSIVQKQGGSVSSSGNADAQSTANGINAVSLGAGNTASGDNSFVAGRKNTTYQNSSIALGGGGNVAGDQAKQKQFEDDLNAVGGDYSRLSLEQKENKYSFALATGEGTKAKGRASHTEGQFTSATGKGAHAEGVGVDGTENAIGDYSHTEGAYCKAEGDFSHAGGFHTVAKKDGQTVVGRYNLPTDENKTTESEVSLFDVGNGTSNADRRNAFSVFGDGHAEISLQGQSGSSVARKDYVDQKIEESVVEIDDRVYSLYSILVQANEIVKQEVEDDYTARETAGGLNIANGVPTEVLSIKGETVASKNLLVYPFATPSKTDNGITYTDNGDGTITANGQSTGNSEFVLKWANDFNFIVGKIYSKSQHIAILYKNNGVYGYKKDDASGGFTWNEGDTLEKIFLSFPQNGTTYTNYIVKPQIEFGRQKTDFVVGFNGLKNAKFKSISSYSKNLIKYPYRATESGLGGSYYFADNQDGSITVNGEITEKDEYATYFLSTQSFNPVKFEDGITYTLSRNVIVNYKDENGQSKYFTDASPTFVWKKQYEFVYVGLYFDVYDGKVENTVLYPQIVYGSSIKEYEPYKEDMLSVEGEIELNKFDIAYPQKNKIVRGSVVVDVGSLYWSYNETVNAFVASIPDKKIGTNNLVCAGYENKNIWSTNEDKCVYGDDSYYNISIRDKAYGSNATAFKEAMLGVMLTYEMATKTEETATFNKSSYMAWKGGREVVNEGITDNSKYGAKATIKQEYYSIVGEEV